MSILGAVARVHPRDREPVVARLRSLPGVDLALDPGDGRLVLVIEDAQADGRACSAAATLATIASWPELLSTSLVYEYSGPEAPPPGGAELADYRAWRRSLRDLESGASTASPPKV